MKIYITQLNIHLYIMHVCVCMCAFACVCMCGYEYVCVAQYVPGTCPNRKQHHWCMTNDTFLVPEVTLIADR